MYLFNYNSFSYTNSLTAAIGTVICYNSFLVCVKLELVINNSCYWQFPCAIKEFVVLFAY